MSKETATTIEMSACGNEFMRIFQDYQRRQNDDPNFDPRTALYDLYADLDYLCNKTKLNLFNQ